MMMMVMAIVWMGRDYVSELWPPTPLLFILHGEPWWNDIDKGKLLICLSESSGNSTSSHLVANQEELAKEINLALRSIFVHTLKDSLICLKILHEVDSFT
jgi:hypothetical protein